MEKAMNDLPKRIRELRDHYFSGANGPEYSTLGEAANALEAAAPASAEPVAWRYRPDDRAVWQYSEGRHPNSINGWIFEPLYREPVKDEARAIITELVRLADMGFDDSLKEPEENGNYAAYERAKRFLGNTIDT